MNSSIQLKKATPPFLFVFVLAGFALCRTIEAVVPPPDGGYPGGNTAEGQNALLSLTTGGFNTAVGYFSLSSDTTGNFNTAVGAGALLANTANETTATGAGALLSNTTGSSNTANGTFALLNNTNGNSNTAVGHDALFTNTTGFQNTATGASALFRNTTGSANMANGAFALFYNTTGDSNIALGVNAGSNVTTADNVICIGSQVEGANVSNHCFIGNIYSNLQPIVGTNPDSVTITMSGRLGRGGVSSRRYKHDIKPMERASDALYALRPVSFRYHKEYDPTQKIAFGLIAEEVAEVHPDLVGRNPEGQPESVRYEQINAMLLNEFLKEHRKVEQQEATITQLKSTLAKKETIDAHQQKQIEALTAGLQKVSAQLAAASPSRGGLEASRPAPQVVKNP